MLYDNCDKCGPEQINLQAMPFKQLAPLDIGRIGIQFREVRRQSVLQWLRCALMYALPCSCCCCHFY
jgi:hypothetical protein